MPEQEREATYHRRSPWTARRMVRAACLRVWRGIYFLLDTLWPKDRDLVIFSQERRYWENSRYFFYYLVHDPAWKGRCVWLSGSEETRRRVSTENGADHVVPTYSMRGLFLSLRAGTAVISHGLNELGPYQNISWRKRVLHLGHGIAIKQVGLLNRDLSAAGRALYRLERARFSRMVVSSHLNRWLTMGCHGVPHEHAVITGLPRNDALLGASHAPPNHGRKALRERIRNRKAILYAPTWREIGDVRWFPFDDFNMDELEVLLTELDAVLLLRPHQYDLGFREQILPLVSRTTTMDVLTGEVCPDIQEALPSVDLLITDYSSIYLDYLLLDRPMLFLPYDLQEYDRVRGMAYDYDLITPGPKPLEFASFLTHLRRALTGEDAHGDARGVVRRMFHTYPDAGSCKRVAESLSAMS